MNDTQHGEVFTWAHEQTSEHLVQFQHELAALKSQIEVSPEQPNDKLGTLHQEAYENMSSTPDPVARDMQERISGAVTLE